MRFFSKISGLNAVDDPVSIGFDAENGVSEAQVAVDCIISDQGRICRAPGYTQVQSGSYHSGFCDGGDAFVAKTTALYQVGTDDSVTGVRSGLSGDFISYCQIGEETYYTNNTQNGIIKGGKSRTWSLGTYTGARTLAKISAAPVGHLLAYNHGHIFVAVENAIFFNLVPGEYDKFVFDSHRWMFPTKVLLMAPVENGMFISDRNKTYFREGRDPLNAPVFTKANYPAYEWSLAIDPVEGGEIGQDPGLYRLWSSPEGLISGSTTGVLRNITKEKIIYPENGQYGASGLVGYHLYHAIGD
jgi:hypothetical protein